jgi:hypothetical protein
MWPLCVEQARDIDVHSNNGIRFGAFVCVCVFFFYNFLWYLLADKA